MKKERGSITIVTLVTIIFMLSILVSVNVIVLNREQAQAEIKRETKKIYENGLDNIEDEYNSYFAQESGEIPIYTVDDLLKIGTGKHIVVNDKIYKCQSTSKYILKDNIKLEVENYRIKYPSQFDNTTLQWKGITVEKENFNFNGKIIVEIDASNNQKIHEGSSI